MSYSSTTPVATKPPMSVFIMIGCAVLMVSGLFLPYAGDEDTTISIVQILTLETTSLLPAQSRVLFQAIAGTVGIGALLAVATLTKRKIFGVFALITSLLIAGFHGLLLPTITSDSGGDVGIGFMLILAASVVLIGASIGFLASKRRA